MAERRSGVTRRELLQSAGAATLALGTGTLGAAPGAAAPARPDGSDRGGSRGPYNVLFILTDQERHFRADEIPPGFSLPGREALRRRGVTFTNHQIASAVCSSSRAVIYTGQHIQRTKVFDNLNFPWSNDLDPAITPTLGHMLGQAGYYAAYKGKWHLTREMDTHDSLALPETRLTRLMRAYGFEDYVGIGDVIGLTHGGFLNDDLIGAQAQRWLRLHGRRLNEQGRPWLLAVNFVNPHDVMFFDTDAPGQSVQSDPRPLMRIAREPGTPLYRQRWELRLPRSRREPFDAPGRPAAHGEFQRARSALVGTFPNEDARWERLLNYYYNCLQESDRPIEKLVRELDALGLAENTIVVLTADHGELAGAHGMHGKGATAFREQNQVPLVVSHPGYPQTHGQECAAVTSHLDLAPTLLAAAGIDAARTERIGGHLAGHDVTPLLAVGAAAERDALRPGALYALNMFIYLDGSYPTRIQRYLNAGGTKDGIAAQGFAPDLRKRGAIRSVNDGRYRYTRYFSPRQHNQPKTLEGIFALNDVELFDLEADPDEMDNLARDPKRHGELLLAMNERMNGLLAAEVGVDDGSFLPGDDVDWAATQFDP